MPINPSYRVGILLGGKHLGGGESISQQATALAGYELMMPLDASRYPSQSSSRYLLEPLLCLNAVLIFQVAFLAIISPASSSDDPATADYVQRGGHLGN